MGRIIHFRDITGLYYNSVVYKKISKICNLNLKTNALHNVFNYKRRRIKTSGEKMKICLRMNFNIFETVFCYLKRMITAIACS